MIGCRTVQDRLPEYAAGRSVPDGERIAAHLARCDRCAATHRDLTAVFSRLAAVPDSPVPVHGEPNARLALRSAMVGEKTPRPRVAGAARSRMDGPRTILAAAGMSGLVTLLGFTLVWWSERPVSQQRVNGNAMVAVNPSPPRGPAPAAERAENLRPLESAAPPPPRSGEGELISSLSRAQAGHRHGYRQARVASTSSSPLRFGEGPGEGSAAVGDHRHPPARSGSGLAELDRDTGMARRGTTLSPSAEEDVERQVRRAVLVRDDFVQVPFPLLASASDQQIAAAVESYKREAAVVDSRLTREVTLQQKATALSDLCDHLRSDTGIQLTAGQSVADEKVTLFCEKQPLRDVMRQLSRPFGYTWLRGGRGTREAGRGEYRYELVQDLRSQLLEEELRNRDRNEALLALERDIDRYRPYLGLSPDEALAREKSARPEDKRLFGCLSREGWGPIHMYYRLSRQDMEALRGGQTLIFKREPNPGERPLPSDLERGVLQSVRKWRVQKFDDAYGATLDLTDPQSLALTAVPEVHGQIQVGMSQSELGQFTLWGNSGFFTTVSNVFTSSFDGPLATGRSPAALEPDNAAAHGALAHDPTLRGRVTLQPQPTCRPVPPSDATEGSAPEPKVTTADVLEVLHRATGLPVVADHYTRLYKPEAVSVRNRALFDAVNHLSDAMRLRWNKDAGWLQFRSASYYHDRLKEVPNRLLARWSAARRRQGILTLDNLVEIAQLPDAQLDGAEMAQGAKECFGLMEWDLLRDGSLRSAVRYLAQFTLEQRQEAMSTSGLPFTKMSLAQQQGFIARAFDYPGGAALQSLEEMAGATLRVDYTHPGWFQWKAVNDLSPHRWVVPIEPGPQGRRVLLPSVLERTREAALQTARRVYPQLSEAMVQEQHRHDPRIDPAEIIREADICPTKLDLAIVYIPCLTNARPVRWVSVGNQLVGG
jgi:hypothetical protein